MLRSIRSYVRRASRITPKQAQALKEDSAIYGVKLQEGAFVCLDNLYGRPGHKVLEIGFGMGQSLIEMAEAKPESDFLGIEVHRPGIGATLLQAKEKALSNLRLIEGDAVSILKEYIADNSFDKIQIFFPDPWPKKRHHKRRLIQAEFVNLLSSKLKKGGILHLATDWQDYADQMMRLLTFRSELKNTAGYGMYAIKTERPATKFERRGLSLGHGIWDLVFIKDS